MGNEIVFNAHQGQYKVLTSPKRFIIAIAGKQGGKSTCGVLWVQMMIQEKPQGRGLVCGLTHDQINNVILDKLFSVFPQYKSYYNKKEKTLNLPTGGKVFFRPLEDPQYVEGITADWAWIDEADLISYRAYLVVRGRISSTQGRLLLTSSLTEGGWLEDYVEKLNDEQVDIVRWASVENPGFPKEEFEALKAELDPIVFQRQYMGIGTKTTGRVYPSFDITVHVAQMDSDEYEEKALVGFDWGTNDPTAILVLSITNKNNFYVTEDFSLSNIGIDVIANVFNAFKKKHKIVACYGDYSAKQFMKEVSLAIHWEILPAVKEIQGGIEKIKNLLHQKRLFVLPKCSNIIREFKNYKYIETATGLSNVPQDTNNHLLDALRYVVLTYPLPSAKTRTIIKDAIPDFWLRRTKIYQREKNKYEMLYNNNLIL
ncbi:MAG: terminase large subunit domain-containing protein [Caldisericum exile]